MKRGGEGSKGFAVRLSENLKGGGKGGRVDIKNPSTKNLSGDEGEPKFVPCPLSLQRRGSWRRGEEGRGGEGIPHQYRKKGGRIPGRFFAYSSFTKNDKREKGNRYHLGFKKKTSSDSIVRTLRGETRKQPICEP